jgi:hypothetical protein
VRFAIIALLTLSLTPLPAPAWHVVGHRLTTDIAFDLLDEEQRERVTAILRAHPRYRQDFVARMPDSIVNGSESAKGRWIFAHASNWPDQIAARGKTVREKYHRSTWHYINLPVFLTEMDEQELANELDHNVSTEFAPPLRRGLNIIQALTGNLLVWRDDDASDADKAVALCWILHLTGDMHEPLHNVALFSMDLFPEGDRGGNLIGVTRAKDVTNLHAVWDGLANNFESLIPDEATRELLATDIADLDAIPGWSRQYRNLAEEFVYTAEVREKLLAQRPGREYPVIALSSDYRETARKIAESQIIIAGHRIAVLISN